MENPRITNRVRTAIAVIALGVTAGSTYAGWRTLPECVRHELTEPVRSAIGTVLYVFGGDYTDSVESGDMCER